MRRVVSLSFYPQGYEWVDPAPAVVSEGHSGRGRGKQQLPDRFRLVRPGSSIPGEASAGAPGLRDLAALLLPLAA